MATFSPVNNEMKASDDVSIPVPNTPTPVANMPDETREMVADESSPNTPTRHSFGGVPGQRPLPDEPLTPAPAQEQRLEGDTPVKRDDPNRSAKRPGLSDDVEMGEGEDDNGEDDGSDNESVTSDSQRPSKKKKGQRFFCTEFPPCQLSFTRSEHLARHIRYDSCTVSVRCILTCIKEAHR